MFQKRCMTLYLAHNLIYMIINFIRMDELVYAPVHADNDWALLGIAIYLHLIQLIMSIVVVVIILFTRLVRTHFAFSII